MHLSLSNYVQDATSAASTSLLVLSTYDFFFANYHYLATTTTTATHNTIITAGIRATTTVTFTQTANEIKDWPLLDGGHPGSVHFEVGDAAALSSIQDSTVDKA
jgi:hypothetical protein